MKKNIKFITHTLFFLFISFSVFSQTTAKQKTESKKITYKYRKYNHVKKLHQRISDSVIKICVASKVPPAAILSIISLESGWGQGYIGRITGNFLSLNAFGNDVELPALKMPKHRKTQQIILDPKKLAKTSKEDIVWEQRPSSLKKDYRPKNIAGTATNLDYFLSHPDELTKANLENVKDFITKFISYTSRIKAYNQARKLLDDAVAQKGISVLFEKELNIQFIHTIGGKPNSFNFRETWPKKVVSILKHVGTIELCKDLYLHKKTFAEAW